MPVDQLVAIPSEYPPLFPWLLARASLLLDVPIWRLLVVAEIGLLSFTVLVAFLMWRRLVPAPAALVISAASLFVYGDPRKAFAIVALFVVVPWLISALGEPQREQDALAACRHHRRVDHADLQRLVHLGVLGFAAVIVSTWRRSADRAGYVKHVLLIAELFLLVSAPYLITWGWAVLTREGQAVSDEYVVSGLTLNAFPFLKPTVLGALELVGLAGLVWYRGRTDWARPLLYLVIGAYGFWLIMGIRFVFSTHTTLFFYVPLLTGAVLVPSGVLTLATAGPALARKLAVAPPHRTGAAVVATAMVWVMFTYWRGLAPEPRGRRVDHQQVRGLGTPRTAAGLPLPEVRTGGGPLLLLSGRPHQGRSGEGPRRRRAATHTGLGRAAVRLRVLACLHGRGPHRVRHADPVG